MVLEGLARQPLRSVVIALAANSFGGGRSGGTEEGELHFLGFFLENLKNIKKNYNKFLN